MPKRNAHKRELHKRAREHEVAKEAEVKAALETAEKIWSEGGTVPFHTLHGNFRLYSVQYFDHFYDPDYYPSKYVEFYYFGEDHRPDLSGLRARDGESRLHGHMRLRRSIDCHFSSFLPPLGASPEPFEIKSLKDYGEQTLTFHIIDNDHIMVKVSRDLVFMDQPKKAKGPETFALWEFEMTARKMLLEMRKGSRTLTWTRPLIGPGSINAVQGAVVSEGTTTMGDSQARRRRKRKALRDRQ